MTLPANVVERLVGWVGGGGGEGSFKSMGGVRGGWWEGLSKK